MDDDAERLLPHVAFCPSPEEPVVLLDVRAKTQVARFQVRQRVLLLGLPHGLSACGRRDRGQERVGSRLHAPTGPTTGPTALVAD